MLQPPPHPSHGHPLQQGGKFMDTSSFSTGMTMVDWGCWTMVSFSWSRCQMCYSVVNNYLSAGRNRFELESGPWTIRATCGKETLYPVPIKFAHWRLKSTWFCPIVMSRLVGTCVADDAYLVQTRDISYFFATWWRGWFILVRHSNKKRDNVAKSWPGSNTASVVMIPDFAMRYISLYLGHDAIRIAILVYRINQCLDLQFVYNTVQYNTSFISNIEHNYIITTNFTQHWDGGKGVDRRIILSWYTPQHWLIFIVNVK